MYCLFHFLSCRNNLTYAETMMHADLVQIYHKACLFKFTKIDAWCQAAEFGACAWLLLSLLREQSRGSCTAVGGCA
jgi:hypothetical protein